MSVSAQRLATQGLCNVLHAAKSNNLGTDLSAVWLSLASSRSARPGELCVL
jgi:hypothetical protein